MLRNKTSKKIFDIFFPRGSRHELFLRTLYHKVMANRFIVKQKIRKANNSYRRFKKLQDNAPLPILTCPPALPAVTFFLAVRKGTENLAGRTIDSLQNLALPNWQVVPVLEDSPISIGQNAERSADPRIKPAVLWNEFALGQLITDQDGASVFCDSGDIFDKSLLNHYYAFVSSEVKKDIIYYDCEYLSSAGGPKPFFKPSALTPELLISNNYFSRGVFRNASMAAVELKIEEFSNLLALEYALALKLAARHCSIQHIPAVLVSIQGRNDAGKDALLPVLKKHYTELGFRDVEIQHDGNGRKINWQYGNPSAAIIILSRNHGNWLRTLVQSIQTRTDYANYSIVIVDNQSTETELLNYYQELEDNPQVKVVPYPQDFNYSTAINLGVASTSAEIVVLLNNDMQVIEPSWLNELVQWASHPEIGVVGARLLYPNRTIQHAGFIIGMNNYSGHLYLNAPENYFGLTGSVMWYRNFHAVTGACQAMRRTLFEQLGGYDERYRLVFGDVHFCLRAENAGFRNLYNPYATLIHFEGGSRGVETPRDDIQLGCEEIIDNFEGGDPFFASHLSYTNIPYCLLPKKGNPITRKEERA